MSSSAHPDISLPAFRRYLEGVKSKSTAKKYEQCVAGFLRAMRANGYENFSDMPASMLSDFVSMLGQQGLSPQTVRVNSFAVKKYLEWVRARGVEVPIQVKAELPRRTQRVLPILPPHRMSEYFRLADMDLSEPTRTASMLLPCCGLRAHEVVKIALADIFKARVKLRPKKKGGPPLYKNTFFIRVRGKGGKERNVPLMDEGVEIITGYLGGWRRRQQGPWLFPRVSQRSKRKGDTHITDRALRTAVQKVREGMGADFTPQTMRRTYVTTLFIRGMDLKTLADIAGHANVQTTIDHYISMEPTHTVQALQDVGSSLMED